MNGEFDELLDRALATYAPAPRPGLQQRVIRRLHLPRQSVKPWLWLALTPAAALLLLLRPHPVARKPPPKAHFAEIAAPIIKTPPLSRKVRPRMAIPKLQTFPAVQPLTENERALLALAKQNPAVASEVALNLRRRNAEPLEIEPLEIPLLATINGQ
jgi:hypothetical protein